MIVEQGRYKGWEYAIYKDDHTIIGFVGDRCSLSSDIRTIDRYVPINIDFHIQRNYPNIYGLDSDVEWIGGYLPINMSIKKVRKKLELTINIIVAMAYMEASGIDLDAPDEEGEYYD